MKRYSLTSDPSSSGLSTIIYLHNRLNVTGLLFFQPPTASQPVLLAPTAIPRDRPRELPNSCTILASKRQSRYQFFAFWLKTITNCVDRALAEKVHNMNWSNSLHGSNYELWACFGVHTLNKNHRPKLPQTVINPNFDLESHFGA